jgi:imidazole glycerol-phosphate synthase subunit HisF
MITKRIIGAILIKDGMSVQSIGFKTYLPIGDPTVLCENLDAWGADEIIVLDMFAGRQNRLFELKLLKQLSRKCHAPLTVGGGIKTIDHIDTIIRNGADKVVVNSEAFREPSLISKAAQRFGDQCLIVSIDAKKGDDGFEVCVDGGKTLTGIPVVEWAREAELEGAGELFVNSIDEDGKQTGFEINVIEQVVENVNIPVIACGGAGHPEHFLNLFQQTQISAAAAGNFFNFTEHSLIITKSFLKKEGVNIRMDTYATYEKTDFLSNGRIAKRDEKYLDSLRFKYYPEEII